MPVRIKPLRDYILIKADYADSKERKTDSGLIIAPSHLSKVNHTQGWVLETGSKAGKDIKKGDYIIYLHPIKIVLNDKLGRSNQDKNLFFVKEENILAVIYGHK